MLTIKDGTTTNREIIDILRVYNRQKHGNIRDKFPCAVSGTRPAGGEVVRVVAGVESDAEGATELGNVGEFPTRLAEEAGRVQTRDGKTGSGAGVRDEDRDE